MSKTHYVFTPAEKRRLRKSFGGGLRLAIAGGGPDDADEAECNAIIAAGYRRGRPEVEAMQREVDSARSAVVGAKTKVRIARGDDRKAARQALRDAEQHQRTVQREARKLGN